MAGWSEFAVVIGGAAAALVGLLFVAVTLRIEAISRAPDLRSRAAQTLVLFVVALVTAIVMTVPDQPDWFLGAELIAVAVLGGAAMLAGVMTTMNATWGIHLLVPAELAGLIGGVLSAWLFLTNISDTAAD